ncbi:MAG TPA: BtpA/SgcQ family protein [Acidimicrobiia bacterium]|nr:BtpA/SgcQ family protein [Acidimicrobiia bacterium]
MKPPSLIGMVHLIALPGSPGFTGDMTTVLAAAATDAEMLVEAGFPALMVENFGDSPFYADQVPPVTVAAMALAVDTVARTGAVPVGVNVLRNDALAALAVAVVTGAAFIRVNVLTGTMFTDQGTISGRAAELARERAQLGPSIAILSDVFVKHAQPPPGLTIEQAALDTWERGGADALIISGTGTGTEAELDQGHRLRTAVPGATILVGSGARPENIPRLAEIADGAIVGSWVKQNGKAHNPVDSGRAKELVAAARGVGWL